MANGVLRIATLFSGVGAPEQAAARVWPNHESKGRWIARLHKNSKAVYLGIFSTKEEAIECRTKAENDYK